MPETVQEEPGERLPEELPDRALRADSPDRAKFDPPKLMPLNTAATNSNSNTNSVTKRAQHRPGEYTEGLHINMHGSDDFMSELDDVVVEGGYSPSQSGVLKSVPLKSPPRHDPINRPVAASSQANNNSQNQNQSTPANNNNTLVLESNNAPVSSLSSLSSDWDAASSVLPKNATAGNTTNNINNNHAAEPLNSARNAAQFSDWDASSVGNNPTPRSRLSLGQTNNNTLTSSLISPKATLPAAQFSDWDASSVDHSQVGAAPPLRQGSIGSLAGSIQFSDWDASSRGQSHNGQAAPSGSMGRFQNDTRLQRRNSGTENDIKSVSDWDASSHGPSRPVTPARRLSGGQVSAGVVKDIQAVSVSHTISDWDQSSVPASTPREARVNDDDELSRSAGGQQARGVPKKDVNQGFI